MTSDTRRCSSFSLTALEKQTRLRVASRSRRLRWLGWFAAGGLMVGVSLLAAVANQGDSRAAAAVDDQDAGQTWSLTAVHHTGLTVSDLDRSVAFYRDILGMHLVLQQEGTAPYLAQITGFPNVRLKVAFLKVTPESDHILELLQYASHPAEPADRATNRPASAHLCLKVSDLRAAHKALSAKGVKFKSEPALITAGVNKGGWGVYALDPDDFTVELFQPPPSL